MKKFIMKWAAPVMCGLFILLLFKFILFFGYVPSSSMEPAIKAGSFITGHRIIVDINRGDVLVFKHGNIVVVKRVAAVEGDMIYINQTGTVLSVNEAIPSADKILEVPEGCYFMLGDNVEESLDSRSWEDPYIKREMIIAKLW